MPLTFTHFESAGAGARVAHYTGDSGQLEEAHLCVEAPTTGSFVEQLAAVEEARESALREHGLDEDTAVFRRVLLSDLANQNEGLVRSQLGKWAAGSPCALSIVEQPPLNGRRVALWEYHVRGREGCHKCRTPNGVSFEHSGRTHLWTAGIRGEEASGAYDQTISALQNYEREIAPARAMLRDDVIRTWFYLSDIDAEYTELVDARKQHFQAVGLTKDTHYIASTGIAGRGASPTNRVQLDAYAVSGLAAEQVKYLAAPDFLGPTHLYGVTFERGTRVAYGDRCHVFISGTASIDPAGTTLHVGDVRRQCQRAMENTEALLADAGGRLSDLVQVIAYVRDPADGSVVDDFVAQRCPHTPRIVVRAAVCRPNWLVEFECIALLADHQPQLLEF